jgi:hypothetical protein
LDATPMPASIEVLDRPRFQKQTLIAQIAQMDSLVVSFASSRLRGECRCDLFQGTGVSDGVANPEFAMNR